MPRRKKSTNKKKRVLAYMTRGQALRKLQLPLKDFRRLCIIKGIYPVEPKNKKVNPTSQTRTYYLRKDIQFLSHEPIIWKFWDFKIFMKRMAKAKGRRDHESMERIRENKPFYKMDHIVKERYPTFIDALRDLDDALSMCFLYSMFGKSKSLPLELVELSRRLTLEFMYYVMDSKSLRKVFISIKGYYYEANIHGQTIRWVVPHQFVLTRVPDVDFQVMRTFTEFYITLLGFVNFRLYSSNSLHYPPKLNVSNKTNKDMDTNQTEDEYDVDEMIAALNKPLLGHTSNSVFDESQNIDDDFKGEDTEPAKFGSSVLTFHQLQKLQNLFTGLKFFLNREVPRESLCFVIRSFSGEVSWSSTLFPGATFDEDDPTITHQIVDRDNVPRSHTLKRYYIQPQWIFDCVNARALLPVRDYLVGVKLPPHLSPFVEEKPGDYVPPEKLSLMNVNSENAISDNEESGNETDESEQSSNAEQEQMELEADPKSAVTENQAEVRKGQQAKVDRARLEQHQKNEEKRLKVMMIPKKRKHLYNKLVKSIKHQSREAEQLKRKREIYDKQKKKARITERN